MKALITLLFIETFTSETFRKYIQASHDIALSGPVASMTVASIMKLNIT